ITTGVLVNRERRIYYPIHGGVPRMLIFRTGVGQAFSAQHRARLARELPGFTTPDLSPMPGEHSVLRTFSSEWVNYDWDEKTYWNLTPDALNKSMHHMLDLARYPAKDRLVLEVGIGIGGIGNYMASSEECELFGVDLSYAVDAAYKHFGNNVFFHIVQASAFALPFPENAFDLVYSQGVLHHTCSTREAFERVARFPKAGGRLYVWLYNPRSETRNAVRRSIMLLERIIRPICWRLPERLQTALLTGIVPLYLIHQNLFMARGGPEYVPYGWREALHAARDRFTPRYAHRHTEQEVCTWFRAAGYREVRCASEREHVQFDPLRSAIRGSAVDGMRPPALSRQAS